jgi:hypothetical protein
MTTIGLEIATSVFDLAAVSCRLLALRDLVSKIEVRNASVVDLRSICELMNARLSVRHHCRRGNILTASKTSAS